jgi:putative transposase
MADVTKNAVQQAIKNLGTSFDNFFKGRAKYPKFKKKGVSRDSFRADNGTDKTHPNAVEVDGKRVKLPVVGWVKMREALRFVGKIKSAIVSRTADRWFVSLTVEVDHVPPVRENQAVGGCDLGIEALATSSDGTVVENPKALRNNLKKLRRLSRSHSRKAKRSANRRKSAAKLARLHARIRNIRQDATHKATTKIVQTFDVVGIEDLNVKGMLKNGSLSRAISDVGLFEFRRQLDYKATMNGVRIVVADRWYSSSKTCFDCKHIHAGLTLKEREWTCEACGVSHDRDLNAAKNLMNLAVSSTVTACGEESSGLGLAVKVKLASAKQEPTHVTFVHG